MAAGTPFTRTVRTRPREVCGSRRPASPASCWRLESSVARSCSRTAPQRVLSCETGIHTEPRRAPPVDTTMPAICSGPFSTGTVHALLNPLSLRTEFREADRCPVCCRVNDVRVGTFEPCENRSAKMRAPVRWSHRLAAAAAHAIQCGKTCGGDEEIGRNGHPRTCNRDPGFSTVYQVARVRYDCAPSAVAACRK